MSFLSNYIDNFKGFSREIWVLTLITFINRVGAMVMLFLTQYLHDYFHFSYTEIGWMLLCVGLGALFGSWLGGKLTDLFGYYTVMLSSLFFTGFGIISIMFLYDFIEICVGLFIVTAIADSYKPAMYVAVSNFSNPDNRTRALTLVRLSVNVGIICGPIIAGLLIQKDNYDMLFWIDGLTCIIAITTFMLTIDESKIYKARIIVYNRQIKSGAVKTSIFPDRNFLVFLLASFFMAFLFFQLFTTIPLFNSNVLKLTEIQIGLLLSFNGILIFLLEMPLIGYLERKKLQATKIILSGSILMTTGFVFLLFSNSIFVLISSIFFITLGQILLFSFSNTFALSRAIRGQEGKFMAFYSMTFGAAQILSPKIGFSIIEEYDYFSNWLFMCVFGAIGIFLYLKLDKSIKNESHIKALKS